MKKDWIRTLLADAIARRSPVAIMRKTLGAAPLLCIPLKMSEKLVIVAPYTDFQPDGFEVVRLRDISNVRANEQAAFHEQVMYAEGVLTDLFPPAVSLESFSALLTDLFALGEPVAVSGKQNVLLLGVIEKAGKKKLRVRYIDGEGHVDEDPTRFAYEDISSVSFGSRYLKLVVQYADKFAETAVESDVSAAPPRDAE
jgi:hypothetical protein